MRTLKRWALAPLAVLLLAACGDGAEKTATGETAAAGPSQKTLNAALSGSMKKVVENASLSTVLEGVGPYTLLAPPDAALSGFTDPAMKAEDAALVRAHLLPGAVTRADIGTAIDAAAAKKVEMRTMAGGLVTFTRDGEAIVAAAENGTSARLTGAEGVQSNGVLQPIDGVLMKGQG